MTPSTASTDVGSHPGAERYLATAHLDLMAIDDVAIPELHRIAMLPAVRRSWRTRGTYVRPEEWTSFLLGRNLFQSYAVERSTGRIVGYTELYDASALDGYAHLSTFAHPDFWLAGTSVEQVVGTLALAFARFPLRKVVAHLPVENAARLGGLDDLARHVGTLADHVLIEGAYADVAIYEVTRAGFERALHGRLGSGRHGWPLLGPGPDGRVRMDRDGGSAEVDEVDEVDVGAVEALAAFDGWAGSLPVGPAGPPMVADLDSLHWLEVLDLVESSLGRAVDPGALQAASTLEEIRRFLAAQLGTDTDTDTDGAVGRSATGR